MAMESCRAMVMAKRDGLSMSEDEYVEMKAKEISAMA
jgi:hypothetical protein